MTRLTLTIALVLTLAGCGKFSDVVATGAKGYATRCIDGTTYILMTSDTGVAITPSVGTDGNPKGCKP